MRQFDNEVRDSYYRLKQEMLDAYNVFAAESTAENRFVYNVLTQRWRDFCVEVAAELFEDTLG
jgi:hypothetical protein